jgi:hypothetical protein
VEDSDVWVQGGDGGYKAIVEWRLDYRDVGMVGQVVTEIAVEDPEGQA